MLIDSHCHLTHKMLIGRVGEVLAQAREMGVVACICATGSVDDSRLAAELAATHAEVYCSAGIHPHEAAEAPGDWLASLERIIQDSGPRNVAVGEIGLDYHYDYSPRSVQRELFAAQLDLAARIGKPVIVHTREAAEDTLAMLAPLAGTLRGVIHSFTGNADEVRRFLDQGWHVGFSGIVTFKNADEVRAAAQLVPDSRLLVETDAPFLSPEPVRKMRPNVPGNVAHTASFLAQLRGCSAAALGSLTVANAEELFGLDIATNYL